MGWKFDITIALLTDLVVQNAKHERKNVDSKIMDIVTYKVFKRTYWMLNK